MLQNDQLFQDAYGILKKMYGRRAKFRPGQFETIQAVMENRVTLVVEKTGWGKSLIYFVCARLLHNRTGGTALVVSPLLSLMENQAAAAERIGLKCEQLNSLTSDRREEILDKLEQCKLDLVLITPETLFHPVVQKRLPLCHITLLAIDEAHCISDWGHDFRLEYSRLRYALPLLQNTVKILATTATANSRVIADLKAQFGEQICIFRGPLMRESLCMQVLNLPKKEDRCAWLIENIKKLHGSGIIYCLTKQDCRLITALLQAHHISAMSYFSRGKEQEKKNIDAQRAFYRNRIKVLVSTIKLGMGYDKGDISFVIHFQMPQNIVSYYQQIGRAGRNIRKAYVFLMCGEEDREIQRYFMEEAFPSEKCMQKVLCCVRANQGMTMDQLEKELNMSRNRLEHTVSFLVHDGFLMQEHRTYYTTPEQFEYHREHYDKITEIRKKEMDEMKQLAETKDCYQVFLANALGDPSAVPCGRCSNCLRKPLLPPVPASGAQKQAARFLDQNEYIIEPRTQWPEGFRYVHQTIRYQLQPGLCLSVYGRNGLGMLVKQSKTGQYETFYEELVQRSADLLRPFLQLYRISHLTFVPSLRSNLVKDFAQRLSEALHVALLDVLQKAPAPRQREMENDYHKCENAYASFSIPLGTELPKRILLVDDVVSSRWTLTVCGFRLMDHGCEEVFPFALADNYDEMI